MCYDSLSKFHNIEMNQRRTEAQQVADSADHIPPGSTVKTEPSLLQPLLKQRSHGEYHQQKRSVWLLSLFNTQPQYSKNMHYATRNEYILGLQQMLCWAIIIIVNVIRLCKITHKNDEVVSTKMLQVKCSPTNVMCPHKCG